MPERRKPKGLSTGDYLRIASAGLDILGAPSVKDQWYSEER